MHGRQKTPLEFEGTYNAVVRKRIAETSVLTFLQDIAEHLRKQLAAPAVSIGS